MNTIDINMLGRNKHLKDTVSQTPKFQKITLIPNTKQPENEDDPTYCPKSTLCSHTSTDSPYYGKTWELRPLNTVTTITSIITYVYMPPHSQYPCRETWELRPPPHDPQLPLPYSYCTENVDIQNDTIYYEYYYTYVCCASFTTCMQQRPLIWWTSPSLFLQLLQVNEHVMLCKQCIMNGKTDGIFITRSL